MPDLIRREGLKQTLLDLGFYPAIVKSALEKAPTIDAVEVVRCKDCKYGDPTCRNHGGCPWCEGNRKFKFRDKEKDYRGRLQTEDD